MSGHYGIQTSEPTDRLHCQSVKSIATTSPVSEVHSSLLSVILSLTFSPSLSSVSQQRIGSENAMPYSSESSSFGWLSLASVGIQSPSEPFRAFQTLSWLFKLSFIIIEIIYFSTEQKPKNGFCIVWVVSPFGWTFNWESNFRENTSRKQISQSLDRMRNIKE